MKIFSFFISSACILLMIVESLSMSMDSVWGPEEDAAENCKMRYKEDNNLMLCNPWPQPTIEGSPNHFRVFTVKSEMTESFCELTPDSYVCPNLRKFWEDQAAWTRWNAPLKWAYQHEYLAAITNVYGNFYLVATTGESVIKGHFGPLFVRRLRDAETWAETNNIPGFLNKTDRTVWFNYFIPNLTYETDQTLATWREYESTKMWFQVGVSLAVTCRAQEINCEPASFAAQYAYINNLFPKKKLHGGITAARLDETKFTLSYLWAEEELRHYAEKMISSGYFGEEQCVPEARFVLYDSNPTPHGNTASSQKKMKNGEVRAVFATWSRSIEFELGGRPTDFVINLEDDGWNEKQLEFLSHWQRDEWQAHPDDKVYFKNWNRTTGMSVAFTICACESANTDRDDNCTEYIHHPVDIQGRDWLQ